MHLLCYSKGNVTVNPCCSRPHYYVDKLYGITTEAARQNQLTLRASSRASPVRMPLSHISKRTSRPNETCRKTVAVFASRRCVTHDLHSKPRPRFALLGLCGLRPGGPRGSACCKARPFLSKPSGAGGVPVA